MNRVVLVAGAAACLAGAAHAADMDPSLLKYMEQMGPGETVSVLVYMQDRVDLDGLTQLADDARMPKGDRHELVIRSLQDVAESSQGNLRVLLDGAQASGQVEAYETFWLANVIRVDATQDFVHALAARNDVGMVYLNYDIELVKPVAVSTPDDADQGGGTTGRAVEPGVAVVRAPEVWAMGYTGAGVTVGIIDTGTDGNHPALASRWAGVADPRYAGHPEWAWNDPYAGNNSFPYDGGSHGTHVMGTVCGGAPGDEIGVAPGAQWISSGAIDRGGGIPQTVADAIEAMEWMADPDGDPGTSWDVPATCSNSWGLTSYHGYPNCDETFWSFIDAMEAAGTVVLFSAGNEGSSPNTLRRPGDRALDDYRTMAVAAIDERSPNYTIAGFSSRGPTYCTTSGQAAIKPDIAAPGVSTRSSVPGGGYAQYSGTSMASPHVNGVIALMLEANPNLTPDEVKQIIYDTAEDLGSAGKDNSYGYGLIDAVDAVNEALATSTVRFEFPDGQPSLIDPNGGTTVRVEVTGATVTPEPGTGRLYYNSGGGWSSVPMDELVDNVYDAVFPTFNCGDLVSYYFSVDGMDGETYYSPHNAPTSNFSAEAFSRVAVVFEETMDSDPGWSMEGQWGYGSPTGGGGEYGNNDPTSGYTGPNCYGYNLNGDYANNMPEYDLTSTAMDCTGMSDVTLSFWRHLNVEQPAYDHAYIRVSTNGTTWNTVWENGSEITDSDWTLMEVDISAYADNQPTVYIKWVMGSTDVGWRYSGWNIDDVQLTSLVCDEPGCPEDLNGDGQRDLEDLGILLASYGVDDGGDIDGDGDTDLADLGALLANYDVPCP